MSLWLTPKRAGLLLAQFGCLLVVRVFSGNPQTAGDLVKYLAREAQQQALQQDAGKKKGCLAVLLVTHSQPIYGYFLRRASPKSLLIAGPWLLAGWRRDLFAAFHPLRNPHDIA